ncbi:MAG: response regulator [Chitinophagaceae bacterium]|nr:response regulator [Chitinophagaceae bacterium]MBP6476677.1 response regulator [Chitinophagaceae bacterium]MBP7109541.1 response regulator [Chitinophagaceae bacterium]MBP7315548.1 response regulator [Chitinophagaceae bacterium]HQX95794.1 response regulator [Chitinophagaceae bacterium]
MKSVLVIDDNLEIRENTAEILDLAGYKIFTAENGKRGVEIALKEKPDVIVCDIMMPELDGYGVLHLIRKNEETEHIPFVFLTAKTERSDFRKGMEMGADDYITKPFEDIELLNAIEIRLKKAAVLDKKYAPSQEGINEFIKDVKNSGLINQLSGQYDVESYSKKQTLYQETKRPRYLYYLVKGKVKGFKTHEDGKEYITDLFSEGDFIGYPALIEDKNYDDSAVVMEESDIMQIPKEDFLQMIYGNMDVAAKFIRIITQNVKEKEERLLSLAYSSLRKRVAKALVDIQSKFNAESPDKPLEISREDFAHYVGTATESLIRTLSDFKSEKLIAIKEGKISIINSEKLNNLLY